MSGLSLFPCNQGGKAPLGLDIKVGERAIPPQASPIFPRFPDSHSPVTPFNNHRIVLNEVEETPYSDWAPQLLTAQDMGSDPPGKTFRQELFSNWFSIGQVGR